MSFSYGFFNAQNLDRVYTAEDFTAYLSSLICNGILDTYRQCFAPTIKNLSVTFGTGKAWIDGHYFISDTLHTIDLSSYVDESLNRYVAIGIYCDRSTRTCGIRILAGTAATSPNIPAFTNNNVTTYLTLAVVRLRAGTKSILDSDLTDCRADESKCGYCKCILGKCRVTEMLSEMAKTNATLDELQKRLDAMNSQISELQTKVDDLTAGEILATGQGAYIYVDNSSSAQEQLSGYVDKLAKKEMESAVYSEYDEQFQAVALLVLLVLVLDVLIVERKNPLFKNIKLFRK